jgi:hypothetical protein
MTTNVNTQKSQRTFDAGFKLQVAPMAKTQGQSGAGKPLTVEH